MKKSARKSAKKSAPKKAARSTPARPTPKARRTPAAPPPLPSGVVPLRTTARIFALNQADMLGVRLSKPALRKATDRVEKVLRERGIGGSQPIPQPLDKAQPEPGLVPPEEQQRRAAAMAQEQRRYTDPPRTSAPQAAMGGAGTAAVRRPLDQALGNLDYAVGEIFTAAGSLIGQLQPLLPQGFELAPGNPPVTIDGNAAIPLNIANAAAKLDGLASLVRSVRDALAL